MAEQRQGRNIVLCSDGTGQRGGPARQSNVWRTYLGIDPDPDEQGNPRQIRVHDDGVGTHEFPLFRYIGGAVGIGISRNIRQLYTALMTSWEPDSRIYLFGFSRGAYTVRVLANLICLLGIADSRGKSPREIRRISRLALVAYKKANIEAAKQVATDGGWSEEPKAAREFRTQFGDRFAEQVNDDPFRIHFIGCWDTVGAIGLPFHELTRAALPFFPLRFRNNRPSVHVRHLCQALAIDEERRTFHPEIWDESSLAEGQTVDQVWFPGVHSNVGGGYPKDQLAMECLQWMVMQAQKRDLKFNPTVMDQFNAEASPHGKMYDSRAGLARYYRYRPRSIAHLTVDGTRPEIHTSVLERISSHAVAYAPAAFDVAEFDVVSSDPGEQPEFAEEPEQKQHRLKHLEKARGFIALDSLFYYVLLSWTILFLWIGYQNSSSIDVRPLYSFSDINGKEILQAPITLIYSLEHLVLDSATAVLPGFVGRILRGYINLPGMLLVMSCLLLVLLYLSRRTIALKREQSAWAWQTECSEHGHDAERPPNFSLDAVTVPTLQCCAHLAGQVSRSMPVRRFSGFWASPPGMKLGTALIILGIAATAVFVGGRLIRHSWQDYHQMELGTHERGQVMEQPARVLDVGESQTVPLTLNDNPYQATGVFVTRGETYEFRVDNVSDWHDASLKASPTGLDEPSKENRVQCWLKRDQSEPLFRLMGAIGPDAEDRFAIGGGTTFEASASGPLFLFVNDVPGFYGNNCGSAQITITRVEDADEPENDCDEDRG